MLTSMMDVMVIILLFLLQTYSVTGALMRPSVQSLPFSSSQIPPRKTLSLLLTSTGLYEDVEGFAELSDRRKRALRVVSITELQDMEAISLPSLETFLRQRRELEESLGKTIRSRELTIQAEAQIPYAWILRLINAASSEGYDLFEFVVRTGNGDEP